jgi:hypothetical protein
MTFDWEKLKKRAIQGLYQQKGLWWSDRDMLCLLPAIEGRRDPRELRDEWYDAVAEIIRRWDVRMVKTLIECFPLVVPKHCLKRKITAYMAESTDWVVEFE